MKMRLTRRCLSRSVSGLALASGLLFLATTAVRADWQPGLPLPSSGVAVQQTGGLSSWFSFSNARFEGAFFGGLFSGLFGGEEEEDTPRRSAATQGGSGGSSSSNSLSTLSSYVPQQGEWRLVPGTAFNNFRLTDNQANSFGIRGSQGASAVLHAANGSAYDPQGHFWYFWGGGASEYGGNEVYRIDLEGLFIERLTTPSDLNTVVSDGNSNNCDVPANDPPAGSTYDGLVWSPNTQTLFAYPANSFCPNGNLTDTYVWEFDPVSMDWSSVSTLGEVSGPVLAEYDADNQRIIVIEGNGSGTIRDLDPVSGQHSNPGTLSASLSEGNLVFDSASGDLYTITAEGVYVLAAGSLSNIQFLDGLPNAVDPNSGAHFDTARGLLVVWSGDGNVHTFDPQTQVWEVYASNNGPTARGAGVFSKWIYIPELDAYAGYANDDEGLWLYRLPGSAVGAGAIGSPPVADAGGNQTVANGSSVYVSGNNSYDPDGDPITYQWQLLSQPSGSAATLSGASSSSASFNADRVGNYSLRLTVSDGNSADQDTLTITSFNTAPVADAGSSQAVSVGQSTQLNGSGSYDANGDPLSYVWTIASRPSGSTAGLSSSSSSTPALVPDVAGSFVIELIVDDGFTQSTADQVTVTASGSSGGGGSGGSGSGGSGSGGSGSGGSGSGNLSQLAAQLPAGGQWSLIPGTAFPGNICTLQVWNGAAWNADENKMYLFGGGHFCSTDNSVWELDLEAVTIQQLAPPNGGQPISHHTYDGIVWTPNNRFWSFGCCTGEVGVASAAYFDLNQNQWQPVSTNVSPRKEMMTAYNAARDEVYVLNARSSNQQFHALDPQSGAVKRSFSVSGWINNGVANMYQGDFLYVDGVSGNINRLDVDSGARTTVTSLPSGLGYQSGWDIRDDQFIFWNGSRTTWIYDVASDSWTEHTAPSGPSQPGGLDLVFSKWVYVPGLDAFAGYYNWNEGLWLYCAPGGCNPTQTSGGGSGSGGSGSGGSGSGGSGGSGSGGSGGAGSADFATRCGDPDVIQCFGFDSQSAINPHIYSGHTTPTVDTSVFASGGGAMRMDILQGSYANTSGGFRLNFTPGTTHGGNDPAYPIQFGSGEEFYVQWRQRFSQAFINTVYQGGGGWKQVIIGAGDNPGDLASSCTPHEVVVQNTFHRGAPQMYHSCGVKDGKYEGLETSLGSFDFDLQPPNQCLYSTGMTNGSCFRYVADEWLTFQVRVKVGTWYNNDGNYRRDSEIELWVARDGQPSELVLQRLDYDLTRGSSTDLYGKVWLLPYNTGKSNTQSHPDGYTWYDELVISRSRVPDPQ